MKRQYLATAVFTLSLMGCGEAAEGTTPLTKSSVKSKHHINKLMRSLPQNKKENTKIFRF